MTSVLEKMMFSEWLQSELNKRQLTQSELARAAGLSRAVINKLLNGRTYPQPETLQAIARAFKIPIETAYRAAGLLPKQSKIDTFKDEIVHKLKLIKSPKRRETALRLLDALIEEDENGKSL